MYKGLVRVVPEGDGGGSFTSNDLKSEKFKLRHLMFVITTKSKRTIFYILDKEKHLTQMFYKILKTDSL